MQSAHGPTGLDTHSAAAAHKRPTNRAGLSRQRFASDRQAQARQKPASSQHLRARVHCRREGRKLGGLGVLQRVQRLCGSRAGSSGVAGADSEANSLPKAGGAPTGLLASCWLAELQGCHLLSAAPSLGSSALSGQPPSRPSSPSSLHTGLLERQGCDSAHLPTHPSTRRRAAPACDSQGCARPPAHHRPTHAPAK